MSARTEQQPAYILHRRPYRETSWLLDLLTPGFGKISAVAKGARQAKNRDAALYQPFQPLLVSWLGKASLKTLTAIEARPASAQRPFMSAFALTGDRLFAGFYLNELLALLLSHQDSAPELFALYETALLALHQGQPLEATLRSFELQLLQDLGVGLDFTADAESGDHIDADAQYLFLPQTGFVQVQESSPTIYAESAAPQLIPGSVLVAIAHQDWESAQALRLAKRILRRSIDDLLHGRELKSRDLIKQFKESQRA